jgi:hypothetical protein
MQDKMLQGKTLDGELIMVTTEINVGEMLAQATQPQKKELLVALIKELFSSVGSRVPVKILDENKVLSYVVPPRVKTKLPLLEDCPEEFEAEMQRRLLDTDVISAEEFTAELEKEFGPFTRDIPPLPVTNHMDGATRTTVKNMDIAIHCCSRNFVDHTQ